MIETATGNRFVATVTVNNPDQRNALGNAGKRELAGAPERVSAAAGLRVVIPTGAGDKSSIAGANLKEMPGSVGHDANGDQPSPTVSMKRSPVPVIARINGWCLSAGLEIAASCDMRTAIDIARCGMPEVIFGLPSGMEACLLPQLIGWGHLIERVAPREILDDPVDAQPSRALIATLGEPSSTHHASQAAATSASCRRRSRYRRSRTVPHPSAR